MLKKLAHYEAERCYYKCSHLQKDLTDPGPSGLMTKTFASLKENERHMGDINWGRVGLIHQLKHTFMKSLKFPAAQMSRPPSHTLS